MSERPALSKAELEVARVVWDLSEATVRQVYDSLPAGRDIDFATVQTYLRRLESKGYVQTRLAGRLRVYKARVKPASVIRQTVNDLVDRLFGGEALPLMRHLVEERGLRKEEILELRNLLNQMEGRSRESRRK
jgi:predicted transcriptional regulator